MSRHVVCPAAELPPGARKVVVVDGREIGVFNVEGRFHALLNRCPHGGAAICSGVVTGLSQSSGPGDYRLERRGEFLRCPWHGWEFDMATGQSWCDPRRTKVRSFEVKLEAGSDLVMGPYVAERYPVTVEDAYIVVDL
ncbi:MULTISPECIES: Rieske (2Fe-2S) protein [Bradyrhizobium]|uniref:Rieske (2Fe-2S) protein n=1 Tax=Bradyrhizobium TaxID=374 RepID=UPI001EDC4762|nr:Rieske (2Fe-2S) protein [Bradyrhizobium zhengyangense]MCG2640999.1 Rieske (2Fe-2S) protein [Bradyrhizobium zhengyangense]